MMQYRKSGTTLLRTMVILTLIISTSLALAQTKQPNIIVIMGDDVGWFNIGVYNQGMMAGLTPHLD